MSPSLKAFLVILLTFSLGALLFLGTFFLSFSHFFLFTYILFAVILTFPALYKGKGGELKDKLLLGEAVLLFLLIMAIRLPSYAITGFLLEKLPAILLVLFWALLVKGWRTSSLGLSLRKFPKQVFLGLGFALIYWVLYQGTFAVYSALFGGISSFLFYDYPQSVPPGTPLSPLLFLFALFLYSNFAEELFFRGFLLKEVPENKKRGFSLFLLQALLFGLYHINYALFPREGGGVDWAYMAFYISWTFLFGIGFGFAYLLSGSVISTTILHVLGNIMQSNWIILFVPPGNVPSPYLLDAAVAFRESIVRPVLILNAGLFSLVLGGVWFLKSRRKGFLPIVNGPSGEGREDPDN
ncbi:MAG: CPBP family intramembrane metalloprotease [Caldiserica bacterium]|jgi:membrane protease YdiL (CAAX protease family)|nr:CPBP family intramembrane metalloprotease [Caldisericota bacterium]MDH7562401.1 type II CAAX endopeptidase family protein [Caldisericota bacterium]